jgi:hypothetical protein
MLNYYNQLYGFTNKEEQRKKASRFPAVEKIDSSQVSKEERQKANDEYLKSTRQSWIEKGGEEEEGGEKGEEEKEEEEKEK